MLEILANGELAATTDVELELYSEPQQSLREEREVNPRTGQGVKFS